MAHALTSSVILLGEMSSNVQATLQNFFGFTLRGAAQMMTSQCHVGETKGVAVAAGRRREAPGFARNCWRGPLPGPRSTGPVRPGRVRGSTAFLAHGFRMARDVLVTETQTQDVSLWAASERAVLIAKGRLRRARRGRRSCEPLILSLGELNCRLDSELRTCCRRQGSATTWE